MRLKDYVEKKMTDPAFAQAYAELEPEFQIARQVIALRLQQGLTQEQLARKMGTNRSSISRLESAAARPSLGLVRRVAEALGAQVEIRLLPAEAGRQRPQASLPAAD